MATKEQVRKYYVPKQPVVQAGDRIRAGKYGDGTILGKLPKVILAPYGSTMIVHWDKDPAGELSLISNISYKMIIDQSDA